MALEFTVGVAAVEPLFAAMAMAATPTHPVAASAEVGAGATVPPTPELVRIMTSPGLICGFEDDTR